MDDKKQPTLKDMLAEDLRDVYGEHTELNKLHGTDEEANDGRKPPCVG